MKKSVHSTLVLAFLVGFAGPAFAADQLDPIDRDSAKIEAFKKDNGPRDKWTPAKEAAYQDLLAQRRGERIKHPIIAGEHGVEIVADVVGDAWKVLESATVKAAKNVAGAIRTISEAAVAEAKKVGHGVLHVSTPLQRHLDVVRNGNNISIAYCNSKLANGAQRLGVGKGENCQVLQDNTLNMSQLEKCSSANSEMKGGLTLARQLRSMMKNTQSKYAHEYFLTFDYEPSDYQLLLAQCAPRKPAAKPAPKPVTKPKDGGGTVDRNAPEGPAFEFHPVDHSGDAVPASQPNGQLK